ncbi:hypothetical protein [Pulveribacter sp.]|uniref:hypothetical protein n=1 Tax=Pulveribacter sp. TaxID=2678893 RepID=UPI0028AB2F19|nr:hypothetical protein [Pulveribacter sp.]
MVLILLFAAGAIGFGIGSIIKMINESSKKRERQKLYESSMEKKRKREHEALIKRRLLVKKQIELELAEKELKSKSPILQLSDLVTGAIKQTPVFKYEIRYDNHNDQDFKGDGIESLEWEMHDYYHYVDNFFSLQGKVVSIWYRSFDVVGFLPEENIEDDGYKMLKTDALHLHIEINSGNTITHAHVALPLIEEEDRNTDGYRRSDYKIYNALKRLPEDKQFNINSTIKASGNLIWVGRDYHHTVVKKGYLLTACLESFEVIHNTHT